MKLRYELIVGIVHWVYWINYNHAFHVCDTSNRSAHPGNG